MIIKTLPVRRALSLLELVISISLIAIVIVGFSQVFQVGSMAIHRNQQEVIATNLAVSLVSEIMSKPFCDPTACTSALEPEAGESRITCGANTFDDVDDYNGYTDGNLTVGPRDIRACEMVEFKGFIRLVNVSYVHEDMTDSGTLTDFKRITVAVNSTSLPPILITEVKGNFTQ